MHESDLTPEIEAFLRERAALRSQHNDNWVVFARQQFQGAFEDYEHAVRFAIERFPNSAFLVRNLSAEDERVPLIFAEAS